METARVRVLGYRLAWIVDHATRNIHGPQSVFIRGSALPLNTDTHTQRPGYEKRIALLCNYYPNPRTCSDRGKISERLEVGELERMHQFIE